MITLAHAGGWDELAVFVAAGIVGLLLVRRAERKARQRAADDSGASEQAKEDAGPAREEPA